MLTTEVGGNPVERYYTAAQIGEILGGKAQGL